MITKTINAARFDMNPETKTLSIRMDTVLKEDGVELSRNSHRCTYVPGEVDRVMTLMGADAPEIAYLKAVWTKQVIADYKAMIAEQE